MDLNLGGEPLNHDGWTFAVDFPRQFNSKMAWSHCVRKEALEARHKPIYNRYIKQNF